MITALAIFAAQFILVFLLGKQTMHVSHGNRLGAVCNSFLIGSAYLVMLKLVPKADGFVEHAAYLAGGPMGIYTALTLRRKKGKD